MTDPIIDNDGPADIAWMRNLAQEGASAPLQGGDILLAAGLLFGLASLAQWALLSGLTPWSPEALGIVWPVITVVFVAFALIQGRRKSSLGGVRTSANRASQTVWTSVGIGIFMLFVSMALIGWRLGADVSRVVFSLIPSIIMVFYGMGWAVNATMMRSAFLWRLSIGSFVAAPVLAAFTGSTLQYLAYAACLFALMAFPGWLLMRKARASSGVA
ncbi:hypothetical protein BH10PSE1_BH10PSE1_30910 [soil metagenome]